MADKELFNQFISDPRLPDFVGLNFSTYRAKWQKSFEKKGSIKRVGAWSWNWAAFFLGVPWLFYRKLYIWGVVWMVCILVAALVEEWPGSHYRGLASGVQIILGPAGNALYFRHAFRKFETARSMRDKSAADTFLKRSGGTSWGQGIAAAIVLVIGLAGVTALSIYGSSIFAQKSEESFEASSDHQGQTTTSQDNQDSVQSVTGHKLSQIFQYEMLNAQIAYLESITGPAKHVYSDDDGVQSRDYRVDGCQVTAYAKGGEVMGYSLNLNSNCNFNLGDILGNGYSSTNALTVGKFIGGAFGGGISGMRVQSGCIEFLWKRN